jgi:hypothetical protein
MFKEADENDKVLIPREKTPVDIIEIEDETNEIPSERKDETNIVDINDKLQLNKFEKEKIIHISNDDRNTYKEKYKIDFSEENIFTLLGDLYIELQGQLNPENLSFLFNDENIRVIGTVYTDFRKRTSKLYGNIVRKNLTDLDCKFLFKKLSSDSDSYCLKYIYFYNPIQCLYNKIILNELNDKYERDIHEIDINLKLDFTRGKKYNTYQISDWFNKIENPSSLNTELKNDINQMLSFFEFCNGRYLSVNSELFEQMDEIHEKEKLNNKLHMESNKPTVQYELRK